MSKLVLHLFHNDFAALATVPSLAERLHHGTEVARPALEVYVFGPAEGALSAAVAFPRFAAEAATVITF